MAVERTGIMKHQDVPVGDRELLMRAQEIAELLQRAARLGYSLVLQPDQMRLLVELLENAGLAKDSDKGFAAWPSTKL
jgi:hypothetical protein